LLLSTSLILQAQTSKNNEPVRRRAKSKVTSQTSDEAALDQARRGTAVSIITALVESSERFHDPAVKVRTQARAADALWSVDRVAARALFIRAWNSADKLDVEFERVAQEARANALASRGGGSVMVPNAASLRSEVLALAARHDTALGNLFVSKMEESDKETAVADTRTVTGYSFDPTQPAVAIAKRLDVAQQFLNAGEVNRAREFAGPALEYVTSPGMIFLATLRTKDKDVADSLYARLLNQATQDPRSDATTVSLMSSYALTPGLLVTVTRSGRIANQFGDASQRADISPSLRSAFFQMAGTVLLRPSPPPGQDFSSAGRAGTYFTIARLLPLFEQYAPAFIPGLKTQLAALALDVPESFTSGQESMLRLGLTAGPTTGESVAQILQQLTPTSSSDERNLIYVKAIRAGMSSADVRMREWANSIEDQALKERAVAFVDFVLLRVALNKNDVESASRIILERHLPPLQQVWAQLELSRVLSRSEPERASQLLEDADVEAHKIPVGQPERAYALSGLANSFFTIDRFRSWVIASDVVKAGNAIPSFSGEEAKLTARLRLKNVICMVDYDEPSFNVAKLFSLLATDDAEVALSTASGLTSEALRAAAHLSIARSILDRQKAPPTSAMLK
jgi:hypothetical protein